MRKRAPDARARRNHGTSTIDTALAAFFSGRGISGPTQPIVAINGWTLISVSSRTTLE
jgi:hypothetical protein